MSYIHRPNYRPLDHRTAFQLLQQHAKESPNKNAIVFRNEKLDRVALTFQEYNTKSCLLAAGLLQLGLVRGDRVVVLLPSYVEYILYHMALNRIGAIMITTEENCYPAVNGMPDLACVVARVEPTITDNDKVICEIKIGLHQDAFKAAVLVGSDVDVESLNHPKAYTHLKLFTMAANNPESYAMVRRAESLVQMDDPCLVMFTSGSTSLPKPIQYTHHAYVNAAHADIYNMETTKDSVLFSDSPFDWVSGVALNIGTMIVQGFTYVAFPPKLAITGNHVMTFMRIIEQESVTHAVFLLYFLQDLVQHIDEIVSMNLDKLTYMVTGGQPTPQPLIRSLFDIWPHITAINDYASTESSCMAKQRITRENLDSIDYGVLEVVPGLEIKAVNDQDELLPVGEAGEICVRSPWVSFCNWDYLAIAKGKQNTSKTDTNGWHFTKDQGVVVNSSSIRLLGRVDFMVKCAAESIPPCLLEDTLQEHPGVEKVCVVGVPDERLYQKICACIVLKNGRHDNEDVLRAEFEEWSKDKFWESSIGFVMKPHYFLFLDTFPVTRTGKMSRRQVRDIAARKLGLTVSH